MISNSSHREEKAQEDAVNSSFKFHFNEEEVQAVSSGKKKFLYNLFEGDLNIETLEALEVLKEVMTDSNIPIQKTDDILEKILSYARWLKKNLGEILPRAMISIAYFN